MAEYISRDDLLNVINSNVAEKHNERCSQLLEAILKAPTADVVEVKHGHWIKHYDDLFPVESTQECSVCHEEEFMTLLNEKFCPNCGAKMDGGAE